MSAVTVIPISAIDMDCKYRSFLCKLSDFTNENYNEHSSGLKEIVKYLFGELVSLDDVVCHYIFDFLILSREFVARLPDRCHIDAILTMAKSIIGRPVLGNEDFRVYFETIFTLLLYHVDFQGVRNKLHFDHDSFFKDYPNFYELSIIDKVELKNLLLFRNWMNVALLFIPAHSNKGRLMNVATRLSEGCMFKYVTGSGQSMLTERRVKIYEHEGRATKTPRHKRRIGEMLVLEKLGYTIDFENNSDSESDNEDEDHSNNIDGKIGPSLPLVNATKKADNDKSNKNKRKRECVRKIIDVIQISKELGNNVDDAIQRNSKNMQIGNVVMKVNVRPIEASNSAINYTPHPAYSSVVDDLMAAKSSIISGTSASISNVPSFNINQRATYAPASNKNSNFVGNDTNFFSNVEHPNTQPLLLSETQTSVTSSSLVDVFASMHASNNTSLLQFSQPSPLPSLSSLLPHVPPSTALSVTSQINSQTAAITNDCNILSAATKPTIAASSVAHSTSVSTTKDLSTCGIPDTWGTKLSTKGKGNPFQDKILLPLLYSAASSLPPLPETDDHGKNDGLEAIDRVTSYRNSSFETCMDRTLSGSSRTSGITMASKTAMPLNITNHNFQNPPSRDIQTVLKHACYLGKSNYGQVVTPDDSIANILPMTYPTCIINNSSSDELKSLMLKTEMHVALLRDLEKDFQKVFSLSNTNSNNGSESQTAVTFVSEALFAIEAAKSSLEYKFKNQLALEKVKTKELLSVASVTGRTLHKTKDTKNIAGEREKFDILNDLDNQWVMDKESPMNQNTNKSKSSNALSVEQSTCNANKKHAQTKHVSHSDSQSQSQSQSDDILPVQYSLPPSHHMSYPHEYHRMHPSHAPPYAHAPPDYYIYNSYPPPMYSSHDGHYMYPYPHHSHQYPSYSIDLDNNMYHNQSHNLPFQSQYNTASETMTVDDHDSDGKPLKSHNKSKSCNNNSNHKNKTKKKSNWF